MKSVLILDLDNTIYPVSSIAGKVFKDLFELIDEHLLHKDKESAEKAKDDLTRRPYQDVADEYGFSEELKEKGLKLLRNISYDEPMEPFNEYHDLRAINVDKYLVTTGFTKLQQSKVRMLGIEADFKAIYIVDPERSSQTKKDIFGIIMQENDFSAKDILVIGDDPKSEIKAAVELGIDTFLFDPDDQHGDVTVTYRSGNYKDVIKIVTGERNDTVHT